MTNEEIDDIVKSAISSFHRHGVYLPSYNAIITLSDALKKSALDSRRMDWLESQVIRNEISIDWSPELSINKGESFRDAIDRHSAFGLL